MQFHQHEVHHPAKETAFIDRFHDDKRALLDGFIIELKVDGADHLSFAKRRRQLRIRQGIAGFQVFSCPRGRVIEPASPAPSLASLLSPNQTLVIKVASGLIGVTVS